MGKVLLLTCITLWSISGFSQKLSTEFGEITMADYNYQPNDKKAEAVVLFDIGKVKFAQNTDGGFRIKFDRIKRVKILKEEGIKEADVSIPLYIGEDGRREELNKVEAYVYTSSEESFSRNKFDATKVFEEKYNDHILLKKFTLPNVEIGSVIEFKYTVYSPFYFQLPEWVFQDDIPVVYSEYEVRMIPYYEYVFIAENISSFSDQESKVLFDEISYFGNKYKEYQHRYIMRDVPAFRDESYISSKDDYLMKVNFQIEKVYSLSGGSFEYVSTWEKYHKDLNKNEDFGKFIDKAEKYGKKLFEEQPQLIEGSDLIKAKNIIEYVKYNYTWNGKYGKLSRQKLKTLKTTKTGSIGDINLLLIGLLKSAGIEASPVLLSSRGNGKITSNYPFQHYFDYVIAFLNLKEGQMMADATTNLLGFNELPIRCINDKGILLKDDSEMWVNIFNHVKSYDNTTLIINLNDDLSLTTTDVLKETKGMDAYVYKMNYNDDKEELESYFKEQGLVNLNNIRMSGMNRRNKPYYITCKSETPTEQLMDKVIIKPFYDFPIAKNPFTEDERNYNVDLIYKSEKVYKSTVNIPNGYKLSELPPNIEFDDDIISISFINEVVDNVITLNYKYQLKKTIYTPSEYTKLKKTFAVLVGKLNVQLVFEPIEE